jgi:tetratricopeptide (TPR) repeat protein
MKRPRADTMAPKRAHRKGFMTRATTLILAATLIAGCKGRVTINYLKPARVTIDPDVVVLAPIDRAGQHLSGEALTDIIDLLGYSGRFQLIEPTAAAASFAKHPTIAGMPITPEVARGICSDLEADGVLALESIQPSPSWSDAVKEVERIRTEEYTEDGETKVREIREEYELAVATLTLHYTSFWSTYDCNAKVLDAFEIAVVHEAYGEGETPAQARAAISDQNALHFAAAHDIAQRYARRISPTGSSVDRVFYKGGSPGIRAGSKAAAAGDWDRARARWATAPEDDEGKAKGKALFDLAVAHEEQGLLEEALDFAQRADHLLDNGATAKYIKQLKRRIEQEKKLGRQMAD